MADEVKKAEEVKEAPKEATLEELKAQIAALEAKVKEAENVSASQKKAISSACSDAADWKRKYRETLDEATRKEQEKADKMTEMEARIAYFEAKERTSTYFSKLVAAGYDPESATKMADGLPDGIPDTFFETQKAFLAAKTQEIKTQTLNSQPPLSVGMPPASNEKAKDEEMEKYRRWMGL